MQVSSVVFLSEGLPGEDSRVILGSSNLCQGGDGRVMHGSFNR